MFYKRINRPKLNFQRAMISSILIFAYMTSFSSCMTSNSFVKSETVYDQGSNAEIIKIELKDGKIIDCSGKIIKFEKGADSLKYIVISSYAEYWNEKRIAEKDVSAIYLEKSELDNTKTTILVIGIAVAIGVIAIIVSTANMDFGF